MTKDVINAYNSPSMAAELIAGLPLHRIDNSFTKQKKQRMAEEALGTLKAEQELYSQDTEVDDLMRIK